jgi:5-methylcytosine-specific restriction endonuclease McrA
MKAAPAPIDPEWEAAREAALRRDLYCCQARRLGIPGYCYGDPHVHHIKRRSQGGGHELDNLVSLCPIHHGWVHGNVAKSKELGVLA